MKKGIEWLATMPYRYQVLFLKRLSETEAANRHPLEEWVSGKTNVISTYLTSDFGTFEHFIRTSFTWSQTPEGHEYWEAISNCYDGQALL